MILAAMWLENRMRKARAKAFQKAFSQARAEGYADGFPETWQRAYASGHKIAYAMGYDANRFEGFAVGYAESRAINEQRWKYWNRRREHAAVSGTRFEERPPNRRQLTPLKGETT